MNNLTMKIVINVETFDFGGIAPQREYNTLGVFVRPCPGAGDALVFFFAPSNSCYPLTYSMISSIFWLRTSMPAFTSKSISPTISMELVIGRDTLERLSVLIILGTVMW